MGISANIVVNNQAGADPGSIDLLRSNAQAAIDYWSSALAGSANVTFQIDILNSSINGSGRGGGASGYLVNLGTIGGTTIYQQATAYKLSTGLTPPSFGNADIKVDFQLSYFRDELWLDPTPYDNGSDIPANRTDAVSVLIHEIGHAIAFNGYRNTSTAALLGNYQSTFDQHVVANAGGFAFHGANVNAVYGGDPALTGGNLYHLGNAAPGAGSDLIPDLMNGVVYFRGHRYLPSELDLATLADIGVGTIRSDILSAPGSGQTLDAGAGRDAVIVNALYTASKVVMASGTTTYVGTNNGSFTLQNAERLNFNDAVIAVDTQGNAGQAYRLYQAALNRTPDTGGLTWHVNQLDRGVSLHDDAANFIAAPEFAQRYGAAPSNEAFVTALYANVLSRAPDAGGQAYWTGHLADGSMDRATVLVGFSESPENHLRVDTSLANGIRLDYSGIA
jgi:hypothetical protein